MGNPVKYQKFLIDNRAKRSGSWLMFSVYKHNEFWNWKPKANYFKTPFSFLSFSGWHFQIGFCFGKYSITVEKHFSRNLTKLNELKSK